MTNTKQQRLWILLGALAPICWGISGVLGKALFDFPHMTPIFLTQLRMIIGGCVILLISLLLHHNIFAVWRNKYMLLQLIAYSLIGLIPNQLCYFLAIDYGDASIATILQFVGPFFIMIYMAIVHHQMPRRIEIICALVAFAGVVIVATNGKLTHLTINIGVLFFGLLSAVGVLTCTVIPRSLLSEYNTLEISGWGLLLAGIFLAVIHPHIPFISLDVINVTDIFAVIIIGTVIPFLIYNNALRHIEPTIVSLLDAFEPVIATIGSVVFLKLTISTADIIGSLLIILAVIGLNFQPEEN